VLAAREALLLRRGDDPPVDDERRRGVVEHGVHTQRTHRLRRLPEKSLAKQARAHSYTLFGAFAFG